ncbi:MAG: anthranilate synthase component I family protein [Myxococcota bacterium]
MWESALTAWTPWRVPEPEMHVLRHLGPSEAVVVLPGSAKAGWRGRFGIVGPVTQVQSFMPSPQGFMDMVDQHPTPSIRVVVVGYWMGFTNVRLPTPPTVQGKPYAMVDLECALVVDHQSRQMSLVGCEGSTATWLRQALQIQTSPPQADSWGEFLAAVDDAGHRARILQTQKHIAAGDIYQANIARPLRLDGSLIGPDMLRRLHMMNPVPHSAYVRAGGVELVSNSMETLLCYDPHTRRAQSFPIKGTKARRNNDRKGQASLTTDPKECAEHVMIVDLVRNDLGRVCMPGTVDVCGLMQPTPYRGVWHGVSEVRGILAPQHSPGELVAALFPGGSITGAPKRRAMQIIQQLEATPRGFYTGSIGVIGPQGRISMSILIRTLIRDYAGWNLWVGGGIVADSVVETEIAETWNKASVFCEALRQTPLRTHGQVKSYSVPSTDSNALGRGARDGASSTGSTIS